MNQCKTCKKTAYCDIYRDIMDYENDPECLPDGKNWNCSGTMTDRNQTLHRVKIKYRKQEVACPLNCVKAETCLRCNKYWTKCNIYKKM